MPTPPPPVRPIVFDGAHSTIPRDAITHSGSKHHVVLDAHAGEKSITVALLNTPEVRDLLRQWIIDAQNNDDDVLLLVARDADNAPRRLVLQTGNVRS